MNFVKTFLAVFAFLLVSVCGFSEQEAVDEQKSPVHQYTQIEDIKPYAEASPGEKKPEKSGPKEEKADPAGSAAADKNDDPKAAIVTEYYQVMNYQASFLGDTVKLMLTPDGIIQTNDDLNIIILTDREDAVERIMKMFEDIDVLPQQIVIEARVIELRNTSGNDTGINLATIFENTRFKEDLTRSISDTKEAYDDDERNYIRFSKGKSTSITMDYPQMSRLINFLLESHYGKIVAEPKIVTINNKPGRIFIGNRVKIIDSNYYYTTVSAGSGYAEDEAGLILEVTPHVGGSDFITLEIKTGFGELASYNNFSLNVDTREAYSTIIVKSGESIVLGGYKTHEEEVSKYKFPFLGDIPVVKTLFTKKETTEVDVEIVLILTPVIVEPGEGLDVQIPGEEDKSEK